MKVWTKCSYTSPRPTLRRISRETSVRWKSGEPVKEFDFVVFGYPLYGLGYETGLGLFYFSECPGPEYEKLNPRPFVDAIREEVE